MAANEVAGICRGNIKYKAERVEGRIPGARGIDKGGDAAKAAQSGEAMSVAS